LLLVLILAASAAVFVTPFGRDNASFLAMLIGLMTVAGYAGYWHQHYGVCSEIRLSDDGTCELVTKRQVIRLHVNEIRSVKFSPADDSRESYSIRYLGGKLQVFEDMRAFSDFLTRLKTLNPAVDLTSFPADTWPGVGGTPEKELGPVLRFFIGAFSFSVLGFVAYEAIHTLVGWQQGSVLDMSWAVPQRRPTMTSQGASS
jgi:hypothetical protein